MRKGGAESRILQGLFGVALMLSTHEAHGLDHRKKSWSPKYEFVPNPSTSERPPDRLIASRKRDQERSNSELLARVKNLEQICVKASTVAQMSGALLIDARLMDLRQVLEKRARNLKLLPDEAPETYLSSENPTWEERSLWRSRFEAATPERRCEFVEIASALAIARLSTLPASKKICKFQDFICENSSDALFQRDLRRLRWELRYLAAIEAHELPPHPEQCRRNLAEAKLRLEFASPDPQDPSHRWPLGRAIGMCARPMSAHYLDEDVMSGKLAAPEPWSSKDQLDWNQILDFEETKLAPEP